MNVNNTNAKKGFTIIEVVLVLAIAGLIFLMVFIALPALQRNQRDTARKTDVGTVASAYTTYTNNNRGAVPADAAAITPNDGTAFGKYITDLSDNSETVTVRAFDDALAPVDGQIIITKESKCSDTEGTLETGTKRQFTVGTLLEGGNAIFCQDS